MRGPALAADLAGMSAHRFGRRSACVAALRAPGQAAVRAQSGMAMVKLTPPPVLNLQTAYYAGYTVLGLTAVSTAYTVFLL